MANHAFDLGPHPTIEVTGGGELFPVGRIFCCGRNYLEHAKEMSVEEKSERDLPIYFTMAPSTVFASGQTTAYPPMTENFHYEMELVVALSGSGFRINPKEASSLIYGYASGLDMTRRDLQLEARSKGRPWCLGKDVEESAVVSPISRDLAGKVMSEGRIWLEVNGETKQDAQLSDLIWGVDEIIANLSEFYHLRPGDLIFTGTPAGVGPVVPGDKLVGRIDGLPDVELTIGEAEV